MRLRVWLPPMAELRPEAPMAFEILDARRHVRSRGEAVIGMLPRGMDCELVLDALDVALIGVKLPRLSGARLIKALPALVEERLLGDVENSHIVATNRDADDRAIAAVVDRALFRRTLEIFVRAGRRVVQASPQPLALGLTPGGWRVRLRNGRGSVRTGDFGGTGFESDKSVPMELQLLISQAVARPAVIEVEGDCDIVAWSEALGVTVRPAVAGDQAPPVVLDLLQYEFSQSIVKWHAWRPTMVLGFVLLLVAFTGLNLNAWKLREEENSLRDSMVNILRESFPEVSAVLDPLAQMQRLTSNLRTAAGTEASEFLQMAVSLGQAVDADSVQSIEYRDGQFTMQFRPQYVNTEAKKTAFSERAASAGIALRFDGNGAFLTARGSR